MKIVVAKYELYPAENPTAYAVGFDVNLDNGRRFYVDTAVDLSIVPSGSVDEDIVQLAFVALEQQIADQVASLSYAVPSIVGLTVEIGTSYEESAGALRQSVEDMSIKLDDNIEVLDALLGGEPPSE